MAEVLNLNNEVVKMRKEVKRARALIIRKLTRQIAKLKKKKGKEAEVEKNQRRAARMLEEIHEMKTLKPDHVTKTALQKNLSFEKVCKNPNSTLSDRALARIATHPQISKKILEIKAAIKAFKDERRKPAEGKQATKSVKDPEIEAVKSDDTGSDDDDDDDGIEEEEESEDREEEEDEGEEEEKEEVNGATKDKQSHTADDPADRTCSDIKSTAPLQESQEAQVQSEGKSETLMDQEGSFEAACLPKTAPITEVKAAQERTAKKPPSQRSVSRVEIKDPVIVEEKEESDLELSDDEGEKEYFDDSTEERFRKQSSQSEGSDEEDDFFLGKVRKFKKRKTKPGEDEEKRGSHEGKTAVIKEPTADTETQGKQDSNPMKLQSVFCSTLSGSKGTFGKGGKGPREVSKPPRFQNVKRGPDGSQRSSKFQNRGGGLGKKPMPSRFQNQKKGDPHVAPWPQDKGPAAPKGRPQFEKQMDRRGGAGKVSNPSQQTQQALHPSWEASKRRKEQQAQITAFQGKKIKFDDD
ncbi:serum response factor-binding protein 1 [Megalops cyprinoides]|uniref:serum response factor-binding protein 1 n=1 Tax=Megalops cyprinoides TaxID=118141 RepID=UPI00186453D5|nr:serum response factor-binding protein 1 [Megalops cyprinoides]